MQEFELKINTTNDWPTVAEDFLVNTAIES